MALSAFPSSAWNVMSQDKFGQVKQKRNRNSLSIYRLQLEILCSSECAWTLYAIKLFNIFFNAAPSIPVVPLQDRASMVRAIFHIICLPWDKFYEFYIQYTRNSNWPCCVGWGFIAQYFCFLKWALWIPGMFCIDIPSCILWLYSFLSMFTILLYYVQWLNPTAPKVTCNHILFCGSALKLQLSDYLTHDASLYIFSLCPSDFKVSVISNGSEVNAGEKITLTCDHNLRSLSLMFEWTRDEKKIKERGNGSKLVLQKVTLRHSGKYSCSVKSICGNYTSPPHGVTVNGK